MRKLIHSPALVMTHVRKYTENFISQASKDRWAILGLVGVLYAQVIFTIVYYAGMLVVNGIVDVLEFDMFNRVVIRITFTLGYLFFAFLGYQQFRNRYQAVRRHFKTRKRMKRIKKYQ